MSSLDERGYSSQEVTLGTGTTSGIYLEEVPDNTVNFIYP